MSVERAERAEELGLTAGGQLVRQAITAYNQGDLEAYFARHTDTTELQYPPSAPVSIDVYRAQFGAGRARWPRLTVRILRLHQAGSVVVMESTVDFGDGRPPQPEAVVFELDGAGLIDRTRVYSPAPIGAQLP